MGSINRAPTKKRGQATFLQTRAETVAGKIVEHRIISQLICCKILDNTAYIVYNYGVWINYWNIKIRY